MEVGRIPGQFLSLLYVLLMADFTFGVTRYFRKICKGPEIEILSNQGVKIEPFDRSHVELSPANSTVVNPRNRFRLDFEFKTTAPNGVLFYGRSRDHPRELIALSLEDGDLVYKIQCPTLHAEILMRTRSNSRVNDGRWHNVSYSVIFRRHGQKGHITIDGYSNTKRYEVSCSHMTSLVMGGVSPKDKGFISDLDRSNRSHFDGCIRKVRIPTALRSPPKYYAVSVCD